MARPQPKVGSASLKECLSFSRHAQEAARKERGGERKTRDRKSLRKFVQAAKTVLLHAHFWRSFAGPLKVNPLSGTIIRNVNLGERGSLAEHFFLKKMEIYWKTGVCMWGGGGERSPHSFREGVEEEGDSVPQTKYSKACTGGNEYQMFLKVISFIILDLLGKESRGGVGRAEKMS